MNLLADYGADSRRLEEASAFSGLYPARVVGQYTNQYRLITETGECPATVSGRFRYEATEPALFPVIGDFVMIDRPAFDAGSAVIHHVLPRRSLFLRAAAGNVPQAQPIAANIDLVFVCMSLNANYNKSRMERYLAAAWDSGARPIAVLTKADLCSDSDERLSEIRSIAPGTDVLTVSSAMQEGCAALLPYVSAGKTASFIGSSGVGKSTLINALAGETLQATGDIREDGKGRHTTTGRSLLLLPGGGIVIDTPGMREFGVESVDLSKSFSDIENLAAQCRFSDCSHMREPGCAVQAAIADGSLEPRRLESYRKLQKEPHTGGLSASQREKHKLDTMFSHVGGMKNVRRYIRENDKRTKQS